jgi:phytol kinase
MLGNNWIALVATLLVSIFWLRVNDWFAHRGFISGPISRKIIHIGTGPIFVMCWFLFEDSELARYQAAIIPLLITIQFAAVGLGIVKDQAAVDAMSRNGDRKEILRGPLFYGIVFVLLTILFWRDSPIGIIGLMIMCGGDGLADIVGKKYGKIYLPWSPRKTWAGTLSVFYGGWILTVGIMAAYSAMGVFPHHLAEYFLSITILALIGASIESLPWRDIDNVTVPAAVILLGYFILP